MSHNTILNIVLYIHNYGAIGDYRTDLFYKNNNDNNNNTEKNLE